MRAHPMATRPFEHTNLQFKFRRREKTWPTTTFPSKNHRVRMRWRADQLDTSAGRLCWQLINDALWNCGQIQPPVAMGSDLESFATLRVPKRAQIRLGLEIGRIRKT